MLETLKPDVMIIGASVAGCAAAVSLHRQGLTVLLIERDTVARDLFKGEFIQPVAVATLKKLGFADVVSGPETVKIRQLRFRDLGRDQKTVVADTLINYPAGTYAAVLPHKRLVMGLRAHTAKVLGDSFLVGATAEPINLLDRSFFDRPKFLVRSASGKSFHVRPNWVLGCDGRTSAVRRWMGGDAAPPLGAATYGSKDEFIVGAELKGEHGFNHQYEVVRTDGAGTLAIFRLGAESRRCYWNVLSEPGKNNKTEWTEELTRILRVTNESHADIEAGEGVDHLAGAAAYTAWFGPPARGRFLLVGDSVAVTTPLGGQGMTAAMLQVEALTDLVGRHQSLSPRAVALIGKRYTAQCSQIYKHINLINFGVYYLFFSHSALLKPASRYVLNRWRTRPEARDRLGRLFGGLDLDTPKVVEILQLWGLLPQFNRQTGLLSRVASHTPLMAWKKKAERFTGPAAETAAAAGSRLALGVQFLKIALPASVRSRIDTTSEP